MPRKIETLFLPGPAGRLESLLEEPEHGLPTEAALVCHPHPQHGGTMHNKVVYRIARGLRSTGAVVLRFNYRGVNLSEGKYADGEGELEDARAALTYLRGRYPDLPFTVAGFSFGSRIALRLGCGIARRVIAVGFPNAYREITPLATCLTPKVFIQSTRDQHGSVEQIKSIVAALPEPKELHLVNAQDHFFAGSLDVLEATVKEL
ncbi:MAG TPA: alpha/beta fold hydrolase [Bryobacteraceae bacterium]|nr:alpha/beta fold hydrolase [Bryobacteraceae bacterium]